MKESHIIWDVPASSRFPGYVGKTDIYLANATLFHMDLMPDFSCLFGNSIEIYRALIFNSAPGGEHFSGRFFRLLISNSARNDDREMLHPASVIRNERN